MKKIIVLLVIVLLVSTSLGYTFSILGLNPIDILDDNISKNKNKSLSTPDESYSYKENLRNINTINKPLRLSFAGDVLLTSRLEAMITQKGNNFILSSVKPAVDESDIFMVNLECPISSRGTMAKNKQYVFRAKPEYVNVLSSGGVDIVTLANNHILDYGVDALLDTMNILDRNNIKYVGAGKDINDASKPFYTNINGYRAAFLASSHVIPDISWAAGTKKPGVATTYNPERILREINEADKNADIVIVYIHWGQELKQKPVSYQKNLAKAYIDKGADVIIGSHPHVLQGLEFYKGKIIAYSLGNFVFTNLKNNSMILDIQFNGKDLNSVKIVPCLIQNYRPVLLNDKALVKELYRKIESVSFGINIDSEGYVSTAK